MKAQHRDPAYQRLRHGRPKALAAILDDGETRELALMAGKGRWEKALAAARALGAEGIECRNEDGAITEVIPLDVAGRKGDDVVDGNGAQLTELQTLLKLCGDYADRATGRQQETLNAVCDTAIQVMKASADRAERSERALDKVLRAHEKLLMQRAEAGEGDGMTATDMMAMMAAMSGQAPPQLVAAADGTNGAGEGMIAVPRETVEKVQAFLKKHPELDID